MEIKEFVRRVLYYLSVPKCVSCGERLELSDRALCASCLDQHVKNRRTVCSVCHSERPLCTCSNAYLEKHHVKSLVKLFVYRSASDGRKVPSNELIYTLKRHFRRDIIDLLSSELANSVKANVSDYQNYAITSIPRSKKRVQKYGYDHAQKLAIAVADKLGISYIQLLSSSQKVAQKKQKSREMRIANAKYRYKSGKELKHRKLLLLDDVVTTGASMAACADMLHAKGASKIVGVCLGIAFKDKYVPFEKTPKLS